MKNRWEDYGFFFPDLQKKTMLQQIRESMPAEMPAGGDCSGMGAGSRVMSSEAVSPPAARSPDAV